MNSHPSSHINFGEVGDIFAWPLLMDGHFYLFIYNLFITTLFAYN